MSRAGAEYIDPREGDTAAAVQSARMLFLLMVERQVPGVLATLRDDVLPRYPDDHEGALAAWAARWNLTDAWAVRRARDVLSTWYEARGQAGDWRGHPGHGRLSFSPQPVSSHPPAELLSSGVGADAFLYPPPGSVDVLPCHPFAPTRETWADYVERVQAWMRANREAAERLAAEGDWAPAPTKRARREANRYLHYEWLARWQVQGWGLAEIALEYGVGDTTTIMKALRATARHIGLTLRR